jgi:hypothetical protein
MRRCPLISLDRCYLSRRTLKTASDITGSAHRHPTCRCLQARRARDDRNHNAAEIGSSPRRRSVMGTYSCSIASQQEPRHRRGSSCLTRSASLTSRCRDHMALTVVGPVLLFDGWRSHGVVGVAELARTRLRIIRFVNVAPGRCGYLDWRHDNQRRGKNC